QNDTSARRDIASFENCPVDGAEKSVAHCLRQHRQVHIEEPRLSGIDTGAEIRVGLIRSPKTDGICLRQGAVQRWSGGGAGKNANFERLSALVNGLSPRRNSGGNGLRRASRSETAESNGLFVFDVRGS